MLRSLPIEERAKLIEDELKSAGMTVIFGGNNVTTAEVVIQIHNARELQLDEVMNALADRIRTEKNSPNLPNNHTS